MKERANRLTARLSRLPCLFAQQVGFRGLSLIALALVDFAYGRTFVWPDDPGTALSNAYVIAVLPVHNQEAGAWLWLAMWWLTGLVCLVNAFRRNDWLGYGMAVLLKAVYVGAVALASSHGMPNSSPRLTVWAFVLVMTFAEAFRAEPARFIRDVAEGRSGDAE